MILRLPAILFMTTLAVGCSTDLPGPTQSPGGPSLPGGLDAVEVQAPDLTAPDTAAPSDATDGADADDVADADDAADDAVDTADTTPECTVDDDCDDGLLCTGLETCSPQTSTCVPGVPVLATDSVCRDSGTQVTCDGEGNIATSLVCPNDCNPVTGACREQRTVTVGADTTADFVVAVDDVSFDDDTPGTNSDTGVDANGHRVTTDSFIWLRFDLAALPAGVTVETASLELYSTTVASTGEGPRPTHLALGGDTDAARNWVQSEATWTHYDSDPAHLWTSGGGVGDRGATVAMNDVPTDLVNTHVGWTFDDAGLQAVTAQIGTATPLVLTLWGAGGGHDRQYIAAEGPDGQRPRLVLSYVW